MAAASRSGKHQVLDRIEADHAASSASDMAARTSSREKLSRLAAAPYSRFPGPSALQVGGGDRRTPAATASRPREPPDPARWSFAPARTDSAAESSCSYERGLAITSAAQLMTTSLAADQHLAMAEPCGDAVIGAAIAHQRQRTDPPRALVAGVVGDCGKALKNRTIPFQAFADRLVRATQLFRPCLAQQASRCVLRSSKFRNLDGTRKFRRQ